MKTTKQVMMGALVAVLFGSSAAWATPDQAAEHSSRVIEGTATAVPPSDVTAEAVWYDLGWIPPWQAKNGSSSWWIGPGVKVTVRVSWEPVNAAIRWGIFSPQGGFLACQVPNTGGWASWDCTVTTNVGAWWTVRVENPQGWTSIHPWGQYWW